MSPSVSKNLPCLLAAAACLAAAGCAAGPDYERPDDSEFTKGAAGAAYTEPGPWKTAVPRDHLPRGAWWSVYKDSALDRLAVRATERNTSVLVAAARLAQARAAAGAADASLFPSINGSAEVNRSRTNQTRAGAGDAVTRNRFSLGADLAYEIDLWGRVRRSSEAAGARADAAGADLASALLSVQAETVRTYFALRALDAERALVERNVDSRRKSLALVERRRRLGVESELGARLAEAELAGAEGDLSDIDQRRAALRLALAVLCDEPPSAFILAPDEKAALVEPPPIPVGLPSELLERRPDVAAAERALAAASADIGAAKAAFFPTIILFANAGFATADASQLTDWQSRFWSLGPTLTLPFFQGGRLNAAYDAAVARHAEARAEYRSRVLNAFREVETCLSDLARLAVRNAATQRAVVASRQAVRLVNKRYLSGYDNYMDVLTAERTAIANERLDIQLRGQRLVASVLLVKAIGGGWDAADGKPAATGTAPVVE